HGVDSKQHLCNQSKGIKRHKKDLSNTYLLPSSKCTSLPLSPPLWPLPPPSPPPPRSPDPPPSDNTSDLEVWLIPVTPRLTKMRIPVSPSLPPLHSRNT
ncbi:hypothetical protein QTG54_012707, partial [Skeletonema marinoi]